MIDATKSPMPAWRRYGTAVLLTVLVVVIGYIVWSKELHHSSTSASPPAPAPAVAVHPSAGPTTASTSTTIPGGIALSSRDPFAG